MTLVSTYGKRDFSKVIPDDIRDVISLMKTYPRVGLWFEIGNALNSFPITTKVDKFVLMDKIRPFMNSNNISDMELGEELDVLEKMGYLIVKRESPPNYFLAPDFAEAIEIIKVFSDNLVQPVAKEMRSKRNLKDRVSESDWDVLRCLLHSI